LLLITGDKDTIERFIEHPYKKSEKKEEVEELYENLLYKLNDVKRSSNSNLYSINRACELLIKSYNNYKLHGVENEKKD
jgi:hypothetical protein